MARRRKKRRNIKRVKKQELSKNQETGIKSIVGGE